MHRTYRGPIFNICVGERENIYFVKSNWGQNPDLLYVATKFPPQTFYKIGESACC
jgi:hypothetical protein